MLTKLMTPVYPLRNTVSAHIDNPPVNDTLHVHRHEHPGYVLDVPKRARTYPLDTYVQGHEYYQVHERLRGGFARGMREAKICLFDASLEKKMIRKVNSLPLTLPRAMIC